MMRIHWIEAQAPRRVLALVKHLGIEAELVEMDVRAGALSSTDYRILNPNGKTPPLVDGDLVLWETPAIMAHLCVKAGSDMWPAGNPSEQVELLRWLSWDCCHWQDAVSPFYFEHVVKKTFDLGPPDWALLADSVRDLHRYARVLDAHLADRDFVACGRLTIADFQLASMACDWRKAEMPLQDFPRILGWLDRLAQLPAWADPWPRH